MITHLLPTLNSNHLIQRLRLFFKSEYYVAFIGVITALANLFSLELPCYYVYLVAVILVALFSDDTLPFAPMICFAYLTVSPQNNPALSQNGVLESRACAVQIIIIASVIGVVAISRFIFDAFILKERGGRGRGVPRLTYGFIALGLAFILGGLFGNHYDIESGITLDQRVYGLKTSIYGGVQILCLSFFYFYLYFTVDWDNLPKGYFTTLLITMGFVLSAEIIRMYFNPHVITDNGVNRSALYTGWGGYNNVGGMMAMTIPAPFSKAVKKGKAFYILLSLLFLVMTILTQSRSSILFGAVVFVLGFVVVFLKKDRKTRVLWGLCTIAGTAILTLGAVLMRDELSKIFASLISIGINDSGRLTIYKDDFLQFLANPIFGNGFYECQIASFGDMPSFIPPRYHNTVIQILASGGIVGMAAYSFHRIQTLLLLFKRPLGGKIFLILSLLTLLLTSLLDCHLFNFGPALAYSVLLILAEGEILKCDKTDK